MFRLKTLTDQVSAWKWHTLRALDEIKGRDRRGQPPGSLAGYYDYFDKLRLQIMVWQR